MKYACELCGMIYDEEQGDVRHGIPAGTVFAELPAYYECPRCGSEREAFSKLVTRRRLVRTNNAGPVFWNHVKYSDVCYESER